MTKTKSPEREDEVVDLPELLLAMRAWVWVTVLCVLCGVGLGLRFHQEPLFEARAIFEHFDSLSRNEDSIGDPVIERLMGSSFADRVYEAVPASSLKLVIGKAPESLFATAVPGDDPARRAFQSVFVQSILISRTANGLIEVVATHPSGPLAAELANATVQTAITVLAEDRLVEASDWMESAATSIAEAEVRLDEALAALSSVLRADGNENAIKALRMDLAFARAQHDLLVEAFNQEAHLGISKPTLTMIEEARVPSVPIQQGISAPIVFGAIGLAVGTLLAGILGVSSGRIYSTRILKRLADAGVDGVEEGKGWPFGGVAGSAGGFAIAEPSATEIMVELRARGSGIAVVAATDVAISSLPAALWLARRVSLSNKRAIVIALGVVAPTSPLEAVATTASGGGAIFVKRQSDGSEVLYPSERFDFSQHFEELLAAARQDGVNSQLIVACSSAWTATVLRATTQNSPFVIAVTRQGRTKRSSLDGLRRIAALDVNIQQRS